MREKAGQVMSKVRSTPAASSDKVISIIGPGMHIVGDCDTTDTVRIEGRVEGSVRAEKAVVVGKGGHVTGDIQTQDAVIAGTVKGALDVESRLELQATCVVDGEVRATRLKLDEGGVLNGSVSIGRREAGAMRSPVAAVPPGRPAGPKTPEKAAGGLRRAGKAKATMAK
ncbi:MAG: polymer-forming cytoskeletal protein [Gemmatimonadota bacterium]|nr:polymer-forming cytoskeletal protein [Gemmatimonadota bacterium]